MKRRPAGRWRVLAVLTALVAAAGCAPRPVPPPARPVDLVRLRPEAVPPLVDDRGYDGLDVAIAQSRAFLERLPPDRPFRFGEDSYDAAHLIRSLDHFRRLIAGRPAAEALRRRIADEYRVYRSSGRDGRGDVLFTGYYEPVLRGCRRPAGDCRY